MEEFKGQQYEEIAEIPEKVSVHHAIDTESSTAIPESDPEGVFEELTDSIEKKSASRLIEDDYQESGNTAGNSAKSRPAKTRASNTGPGSAASVWQVPLI